MLREIDGRARLFPDSRIHSIYFGGGTPSLLDSGQIARILCHVRSSFHVDGDAEITLEANPATMDRSKLEGMVESGINRVSLGVQSFDDAELGMLGRVHSRREVFDSLELFSRAGVKNYNIDLIYGLPGQSSKRWLDSLEQAVSCRPRHISMYLLQLDPDTPLGRQAARNQIILLDEEREAEMYYTGIDYLNAKGYRQYEISNLSVPGSECRHNLFYWQAESYLGLGPGAVSFTGSRRYRNQPDVGAYLQSMQTDPIPPSEELERMDEPGLVTDAVILGLRLIRGIDLAAFERRFGVDILRQYSQPIRWGQECGLLKISQGHLYLTRAGYFLSNEVLCRFMA